MLPSNRGDREYFRFFQDNVAYADPAGTSIPIGQFVGGQYNSTAPTYTDGDPVLFQFTSDGRLKTDTDITVTNIDVQLGAVEIKNATDDTRAVVAADGTGVNALTVKINDAMPLAAGNAVVGQVKITDDDGDIANVIGGRLQVDMVGVNEVSILSVLPGTNHENLGKAEDAVHASGDVGVMSLAVRNDTLAALAGTDGDYAPFQVDAGGALFVQGAYQEDAGHTSADYGHLILTVRQNTAAALSGTDADYQPLITDTNGRLHTLDQHTSAIKDAVEKIDDWEGSGNYADYCKSAIYLDNASGSPIIGLGDANGHFQVDILSIIPGTGATNLGKAEDAQHATGDTGVMALAVRSDTLASLGGATNDYVPLQVNASGALYVTTEEAQGTAPQAYGIDVAGADTYTTIVTASGIKYHLSYSLQGANDAILTIDSGTTDHFYLPANSAGVFDNIVIANSATVQGKNASAGSNYTNLTITIW